MITQVWREWGEDGVTRYIYLEVSDAGWVQISIDVLAELLTDNGWEHIETHGQP